jgi:transposase
MLKIPTLNEIDQAMAMRIYLAVEPADMRKGFDALAALVRDHLGHDPLGGGLFLFLSRRRDRLKILYWDRDGYALWYKRLEEGTFRIPIRRQETQGIELKPSELAMLLEGIDLGSIRRGRRFVYRALPT